MLPALLIGYNRPSHTARVVESLRQAGIEELFVALDGPRPEDQQTCGEVRTIIENLTWPKRLEIRFVDANQGPGWGPRNAITWFFTQVPVGIICEDDTAFSPDAALFLTAASADFRSSVPMAAATSLGSVAYRGRASYFASRYATTWGWSTTASAWEMYDHTMEDWPNRRSSRWLHEVGSSNDFRQYWTNIFDMTYADRDHYWDYQWQFAMWEQGWRCWHPRVNLVTNIGFDEAATHTRIHQPGLTRLPIGTWGIPVVPPDSEEPDSRVDRWIDRNVYRTRRTMKGRVYRALLRRGE